MGDTNLGVKEHVLKLITATLFYRPGLLAAKLPEIMVTVGNLARLTSLITVDLGPFKHTVDKGIPLRKEAAKIHDIVLNKLGKLDVESFMSLLAFMLADDIDVAIAGHGLLVKLAASHPTEVAGGAVDFLEPLDKIIHKKVKSKDTETEKEKAADNRRSAMRSVWAMSKIKMLKTNKKFMTTTERLGKNASLVKLWMGFEAE